MCHIDFQQTIEQLYQQLKQIEIADPSTWNISTNGSMQHWQDIISQIEDTLESEVFWFDTEHDFSEYDVYSFIEQAMLLKDFCLEMTYLLRLSYDLGVDRELRAELYHTILDLWFAYADLLLFIQSEDETYSTIALNLDVDYSFALLLLNCAIVLDQGESVVKIVDGLLHYQNDRLLDILSYPYFENPSISEDYQITYPYQQLDSILNTTVDEKTISTYLTKIAQDQESGRYFEKKRFHKLSVLGQWSFEVLGLCAVYQIAPTLFKDFKSMPYTF
ncbi:PoNe immunity protein domain-containing protein [Acinetobacter wuhouensis]|uniref:DUF1911 domain-containing protein n=1 Tax=Acinetobacter wuhouensis TaxID=1879050 RepID=A0A4Q7AHU4_9GAMM|nr:PoNe immunity protein domain-containing protein [Acinetobacter wuhouensis]RZG44553.1 DUF1911 domain-containing protein [Acinetobacter wuhouensis]RZG73976.1 DUF1911 domain-containing protein [Acinetobacter wuhouensis]